MTSILDATPPLTRMIDVLISDITIDDLPPGFRSVAESLGIDIAARLIREFPGEMLYIPSAESVTRPARDEAVYKAFDGTNADQVCRTYGISRRTLQRITRRRLVG